MIKNKLKKAKISINEYKGNSAVSDSEMANMYEIPNMTSDITKVALEEKDKLSSDNGTVRILNDNMTSMYNMLKNK